MIDKSFTSSAVLSKTTTKGCLISGSLLKQDNDVGYRASAMLIGITQCQVPGATTLPSLLSVNLQMQGDSSSINVPKLILLPTLVAIDIRTKSC